MCASYSGVDTCPPACRLYKKCYATGGPVAIAWRNVKTPWDRFLANIYLIPEGELWRHNIAGDLAGKGNRLHCGKLKELVKANEGRRGFTYTHKPLFRSGERQAIAEANRNGFTINLSADTLKQADEKKALGIGPVVVLLPKDQHENCFTPAGNKVVVCPFPRVQCIDCGLCQKASRSCIVGFPAHGFRAAIADTVARGDV